MVSWKSKRRSFFEKKKKKHWEKSPGHSYACNPDLHFEYAYAGEAVENQEVTAPPQHQLPSEENELQQRKESVIFSTPP